MANQPMLNMPSFVKSYDIVRSTHGASRKVPDLLAIEEPLEVRIGFGPEAARQQKSLSVTMRTPGHDFELALGFLFTEGIIHSYQQVESIRHCEDVGRQEQRENIVRVELKPDVAIDFHKLQRNFYTTSSCGVCGKSSIDAVRMLCTTLPSTWRVNASVIHALPERARTAQTVFEHTGGLHASALFALNGELVLIREDVGRHNALDKVIGAMLVEKQMPLLNSIVLVSGRASFELVQKAALAGIPMLVAVGAPSSLAVNLARDCGMSLLGFARDKRFNVYAGEERVGLA
jgi:FdhD protein